MNIKRLYALAFGLFFLFYSLPAQNCYVPLDDASGFDTSPYQQDLENAACELIQSFPQEFQNQFKVYDFGFYLHQEDYQGGFPQVFLDKVAEVEQLSPYYLLFGKQTDGSGVYTRIWVELKLPNNTGYLCLNENAGSGLILQQAKIAVENTYNNEDKDPYSYAIAEMAGISKLRQLIDKSINCCEENVVARTSLCSNCFYSEEDMAANLEYMGFLEYDTAQIFISSQTYTGALQSDYRIDLVTAEGYFFTLTDDLEDFLLDLGSGSATVFHFDEDNCQDFGLFLNGVLGQGGPVARGVNLNSYQEEIVILEFGGEVRVFYQFYAGGAAWRRAWNAKQAARCCSCNCILAPEESGNGRRWSSCPRCCHNSL